MGNQGCWVEAGMLVLPRGTHLLPICVFACLAGTPSATDHLLHGVRQQRQRGLSGSTAGIAARSRLCLPWLWCALMDSVHSYERLWHFIRAVHPAERSPLVLYPSYVLPHPCIWRRPSEDLEYVS